MDRSLGGPLKFLFFLIFAFSLPVLAEVDCEHLLSQGRWEKILERVEKLNPEIRNEFSEISPSVEALEKLYLRLKKEAWRWAPRGLLPFGERPEFSEDIQSRLREEFGNHFSLTELRTEQLYLFYVNSYQSIYTLVFMTWLEKIANQSLPVQAPANLKSFAIAYLYNQLDFDPQSLSTSPESAAEIFKIKIKSKEQNWNLTLPVAQEWLATSDLPTAYLERRRLLQDFLASKKIGNSLATQHLESALLEPGFKSSCCKSTPGCHFCPNNRAWLKKKSD